MTAMRQLPGSTTDRLAGRAERIRTSRPEKTVPDPKKKIRFSDAWQDARDLVHQHRGRLLLGLGLMLINRAAGFVLPLSPKVVLDEAIGKHRPELFPIIAAALIGAVIVQAGTSFALSQLLGVAAQRAITDMRKAVMAHVTRLPVRYFDSTQSGILISRVMTDAEGIRNLVGTGLVQLTSSIVTAVDRARHSFSTSIGS
jgi:subfamily B ATP-binding cassette protein MsbA